MNNDLMQLNNAFTWQWWLLFTTMPQKHSSIILISSRVAFYFLFSSRWKIQRREHFIGQQNKSLHKQVQSRRGARALQFEWCAPHFVYSFFPKLNLQYIFSWLLPTKMIEHLLFHAFKIEGKQTKIQHHWKIWC